MPGSPQGRRRLRRALLVAIAALYAVSIPWYRAPDAAPAVWLGLPDWVAVALGCYVLAAVANAWAWTLSEIPDGEPERPPPPGSAAP